MRQRFHAIEVFEELGWDAEETIKYDETVTIRKHFQEFLFQRVIPSLKTVGLLTDSVRPKFEELGVLQWEDFDDDDVDWREAQSAWLSYRLLIFKNLLRKIEKVEYINSRRWNIYLKNGLILKLPETNITDSFKNYKEIYNKISNDELQKIESIDLRMLNKAILKFVDTKND